MEKKNEKSLCELLCNVWLKVKENIANP